MPSNTELRAQQNNQLFQLLRLKIENEGITVKGLDILISQAKSVMIQEDVAWVEKMVAETK